MDTDTSTNTTQWHESFLKNYNIKQAIQHEYGTLIKCPCFLALTVETKIVHGLKLNGIKNVFG